MNLLFCPVDEADLKALVAHYEFKVACWSYSDDDLEKRKEAQSSLDYWQEQLEQLR